MKKAVLAVVVVVVVLIAGGGYLWWHKSQSKAPATSNTSSNVSAINNSLVITKTSSSLGQYLATPNGQALYTYGKDTSGSGVSNCTSTCIVTWPAYKDTGTTADLPTGFGTIKRSDNGETQYTYNGKPLYTFLADIAGQVTGNGVSDFSLAKPAAATPTTTPATTSSSSSSSW